MSCSSPPRPGWRRSCARATSWPGSAGTSSSSSCANCQTRRKPCERRGGSCTPSRPRSSSATTSCSPPRASGWRSRPSAPGPATCCGRPTPRCTRRRRPGRDRVSMFNEDLRTAVAARMTIEADLRHALDRGELAVWYQPEVDLGSGAVVALEALVRWRHPDGSVWTADRFVDVAEETGLILDIGDWVLRQACIQGAAWALARPDRPADGPRQRLRPPARRDRTARGASTTPSARAGWTRALHVRRDHRDRAPAPDDDDRGEPRGDPRPRHLARHRRLRHRLRLPDLPQPVPHRRDQDRPQLHHRGGRPRRPASSPGSSPSPRPSTSR